MMTRWKWSKRHSFEFVDTYKLQDTTGAMTTIEVVLDPAARVAADPALAAQLDVLGKRSAEVQYELSDLVNSVCDPHTLCVYVRMPGRRKGSIESSQAPRSLHRSSRRRRSSSRAMHTQTKRSGSSKLTSSTSSTSYVPYASALLLCLNDSGALLVARADPQRRVLGARSTLRLGLFRERRAPAHGHRTRALSHDASRTTN